MSDDVRGVGGQEPGAKGEADKVMWACTNCGYSVEGEVPESCPDCGAPKEDFESVPVPGM
jgi:rubrerythrin